MNWHTETVAEGDLDQMLSTIRRAGGSITHSFPSATGYTVIYTTFEGRAMRHDDLRPEDEAQLAAWWRQGFADLDQHKG